MDLTHAPAGTPQARKRRSRDCPLCARRGKPYYHTERDHPAGGEFAPYYCAECMIVWDVHLRPVPGYRAADPRKRGRVAGCD